MSTKSIKAKITPILRQNGVVRAGLFGSYATGHATKDSDIDLLVEFSPKKSLFEVVDLKLKLEEALKKEVDLVTYRSIHPLLKENILSQQQVIY